MRAFFITLLVLALLAAGTAWWLWQNARRLPADTLEGQLAHVVNPPPIQPPARSPMDYHVLEDQGGIPLAEAQRAGLVTAQYAYLRGLTPVQLSDGVGQAGGAQVRGKRYDLCYRFETRLPEEQYLEFNLEGNWNSLDFGFGFTDTEPSDPSGKLAIVLEIKLDGAVAYASALLKPTDKPVFTTLPVAGVNRVLFTCRRVGYRNMFAPVLLDPFVTAAAS